MIKKPDHRISAVLSALPFSLAGCTIATPFNGPGVSEPGDKTVVVALSHAVLDNSKRKAFDRHTQLVVDALPRFEGFIGYSVRKELFGNEAWTMTVWRDDAALEDFVSSPVHEKAVKVGMPATRSVRFHRFEVNSSEVPLKWDRALALLETQGTDNGYGP